MSRLNIRLCRMSSPNKQSTPWRNYTRRTKYRPIIRRTASRLFFSYFYYIIFLIFDKLTKRSIRIILIDRKGVIMKIPIVYGKRPVITAREQFKLPQNRKVIVAKTGEEKPLLHHLKYSFKHSSNFSIFSFFTVKPAAGGCPPNMTSNSLQLSIALTASIPLGTLTVPRLISSPFL